MTQVYDNILKCFYYYQYNYLTTANEKKMKLYQDTSNLIGNNFNRNDYVGIAIHTVDRTNIESKILLPCSIIKSNTFFFYIN